MIRIARFLVTLFALAGLAAVDGSALAQPKDKDKDKDRKEQSDPKGKGGKEHKVKKQKHENGKNLVGDKIKKNGKHAFHQNGKHTSFVEVKDGKIAGVSVKHADKGDLPIRKYKTTKKMAEAQAGGMQRVSLTPVQLQYLGTTWIGYAYYDDYGDEVIYWFPYDMIYDGDTGAIEYVPVYS